MPRHIVSLTVNTQGADDDYDRARRRALDRLSAAAVKLASGRTTDDPGVNVDDRDPGGGGGPCVPQKYSVDVIIDASVLPEAQNNDDD